jgi:hypothetical protein
MYLFLSSQTLILVDSSDKDESDANDVEASILGFQSYWDSSYAEDLTNFHLHGQPGEVWYFIKYCLMHGAPRFYCFCR